MEPILDQIYSAFLQTSWLERFSVLCSVVQVILSANNKVSNYLFGILGIVTSMFVLIDAKLYAEFLLSLYYLVMSVYGLWYWRRQANAVQIVISKSSFHDWSIVIAIVGLGYILLYALLKMFTDSDVPMWDAAVSATAWAGMWLMAKRKLENWVLLNISNAIAIPLLIHKELYLFAALTVFLFVVAILGFFKWKRILSSVQTQSA